MCVSGFLNDVGEARELRLTSDLSSHESQEELCLKWILELPVPRLVTVLKELRWLHPGTLEDLTQDVAADLMAR